MSILEFSMAIGCNLNSMQLQLLTEYQNQLDKRKSLDELKYSIINSYNHRSNFINWNKTLNNLLSMYDVYNNIHIDV